MGAPTSLAELRTLLAEDLPAGPAVLLAVCSNGSRLSITCDDDVIAIFDEASETLDIEVRSLFPGAGAQPRIVRISAKGRWPRATPQHEAPCKLQVPPRPEIPDRPTEPSMGAASHADWLADLALETGREVRKAGVLSSGFLVAANAGPDWGERSNLERAGLRPTFGVPWPEILPAREAKSVPVEITDAQEDPVSAHLLEAMGLRQEYKQLRRGMRQHRETIESILQDNEAFSEPCTKRRPWKAELQSDVGEGQKIHSRDLPHLRNTMHLLRQLENTTSEALQDSQLVSSWWIPGAKQRLSEERWTARHEICLVPLKKCWCSSWVAFGKFSQVAFRIYPTGDGESAEGHAVVFFWMQSPPLLSFSFQVYVGELLAIEQISWRANVNWSRAELAWGLIEAALLDPRSANGLRLQMRLLEWHAPQAHKTNLAAEDEKVSKAMKFVEAAEQRSPKTSQSRMRLHSATGGRMWS
mmetsp:Transcript_30162/g.54715  ORF Transcript_30162/g.54715 Transcript_30162/m.54715 type:complete len:470 (-) Transcript_30162:155-1564(-)